MTTDHDPFCGCSADPNWPFCACRAIRGARADERERIAQAIEAFNHPVYANIYPSIYVEDAARIAREEGQR